MAWVQALNKGGVLHNIHICDEKGGALFNISQPAFKKTLERQLEATGVINFKYDLHEWMYADGVLRENAPMP